MDSLFQHKKIIIMLGSGGVGKTTCSIGLAIHEASLGRHVGLLSIDPAKRLSDALGITLGSRLKPVDLGLDHSVGSLEAAMLDHKVIFDDMVKKHSKNKETTDKILSNPLYIAASSKLAGPMEYMALSMLQDMIESEKYDLIILDTPPALNAIDFLERPNILHHFFENNVMQWLIKPFFIASKFGLSKLFTVGEKLMGSITKVTGLEALSMLSEFLILMQTVIEGFEKSAQKIHQILRLDSTSYCLVVANHPSSLRTGLALREAMNSSNLPIQSVLINRCLPAAWAELSNYKDAKSFHLRELAKLASYDQQAYLHLLDELAKSSDLHVLRLPEKKQDLHSLSSMIAFSKSFQTWIPYPDSTAP